MAKLKIGVSECLLGENVRFDGGHKKDNYLVNILKNYIEYIPVCPEVAIGMGVPRPPIRQVGDPKFPQIVGVKDNNFNVTKKLENYSKNKVKELDGLTGFILKSKSPTCGMERVKVYQQTGQALTNGVGVFARALMEKYPHLPIEEEGRLCDPVLRENFITRIFAYARWQELVKNNITKNKLVQYHTQHKLLLRSHNEAGYQKLGKLMADLKNISLSELKKNYVDLFMATLKTKANTKKHANVLYHVMGYLKKDISNQDKAELIKIIENYRLGQLPLIVPITLLNHHFSHFPDDYISEQVYFNPHPEELMLRNHV